MVGHMRRYKPVIVVIGLQCLYAGLTLFTRAAMVQGMSPRVFVVYRQAFATFIMAPISYFTRKNSRRTKLGLRSFGLIFLTALIGVTANHNAYFEGLYLSSSTITTAMTNLMPAVTFVMAASVGLEKVQVRSMRSISKIMGTLVCVSGAMCMALFQGPQLFDTQVLAPKSFLSGFGGGENLQLGCLVLFLCCCCWSFWMIMQVPISVSCPDHVYSTLWMCFLASIQSFIFALLVENDLKVWRLSSVLEIGSCIYAGIVAALSFYGQAWCISERGPLFVAMFNPLCTVITAIIASSFLHEKLYLGSLVGALAIILGLYAVLWGKAKDYEDRNKDEYRSSSTTQIDKISREKNTTLNGETDLEESFLGN